MEENIQIFLHNCHNFLSFSQSEVREKMEVEKEHLGTYSVFNSIKDRN